MSLVRSVAIGVGAAAMALVACNSGTGTTGGTGGDAQSFINDFCGTVGPCCAQVNKPTDGQACRTLYTALTSAYTYDAAAGSACLNELHATQSAPDYCMTFTKNGPSCKNVFRKSGSSTGTRAPGATCDDDGECAASSEGEVSCASNFSGTSETRTCQVEIRGKENDTPCNQTKDGNVTSFSGFSSSSGMPMAPPPKAFSCDVADGVYCNDTTKKCTKIQGPGGPCESFSSHACTKDAFCDFSTKKCVARIPLGGDCSKSSTGCVENAFCPSDTHKCTAQLADGAACKMSQECQSDRCVNMKCDPGGSGSTSISSLALLCGGQ